MQKQYHGITVNDLYNAIYVQFNHLVDEILTYESDTFSSEGSELTPAEAERVAFALILRDMERRASTETMDGGMIADALEEIRGEV